MKNIVEKTHVEGAVTFFKHKTKRNKCRFGGGPLFLAEVEEFTPSASKLEDTGEWIANLPHGCTRASFNSAEAAIVNAERSLLFDADWTTDRGLAERRAAKELELRNSGRLRFAKGRLADFIASQKEIMEVK